MKKLALYLNYVSIYNFVKKLIYIINLKYITMTKKFNLKTAKKKVFFFLKRSYKIIPFNNNNAICQRNITEQPSNMNFQFPGCSVFWEVLKNVWMKLRVYLLFLMATLYVYTIICIHSKFKKKILVCFLYFWCGLFVKFIFCLIYVYCLRELQ